MKVEIWAPLCIPILDRRVHVLGVSVCLSVGLKDTEIRLVFYGINSVKQSTFIRNISVPYISCDKFELKYACWVNVQQNISDPDLITVSEGS